jgi:uncharacterized membrane protein YgcG
VKCLPLHPQSPPHGRRTRAASGFTLAELIVASIILTLVVGATTVAISQSIRSRDSAVAAGDAFSRAHVAAARIAADAAQTLRDGELIYTRLAITRGGPGGSTAQGLSLFSHLARNVRATVEAIESDEYELQYRLEPGTTTRAGTPSYTLWRRADPIPDEYVDAGGVASPMVDGLVSLSLDAYDGAQWRNDWDSDLDGYPHALRIVVTATDDGGRRTSTARRVVAFDRTPPPIAESEEEEESTDQGDTGAETSTSGGATGGTGGATTGGGGGGTGGAPR